MARYQEPRIQIPPSVTLVCLGITALILTRACHDIREKDAADAESQRTQEAQWKTERAFQDKAESDRFEAKEREREAAFRAGVEQATALKPGQRLAAILRCSRASECIGGTSDPTPTLQGATTPAERATLQQAYDRSQAAIARADAPLSCCDGSFSPSCTCGSPRSGCCSHHRGVCGCSADKKQP